VKQENVEQQPEDTGGRLPYDTRCRMEPPAVRNRSHLRACASMSLAGRETRSRGGM
jgi:hypothetical protein